MRLQSVCFLSSAGQSVCFFARVRYINDETFVWRRCRSFTTRYMQVMSVLQVAALSSQSTLIAEDPSRAIAAQER